MDASTAVQTVLCNEEAWHWSQDNHKLVFYRDGTGEIISYAELCVWIVAIFEWKIDDPSSVQYTPNPEPSRSFISTFLFQPPPQRILTASIEFRLTQRRPLLYGKVVRHRINEDVLLDAAFRPRVLHIVVERGRFAPSCDSTGGTIAYESCLTFDESPFPPKAHWRVGQHNMLESVGQHRMVRFCAGEVPISEGRRGCVVM
ncbi:hypothetical protein C8J57DRAFT_703837 [Mycena rebaudengoi]|nr:hypothetical protein C8J57DRAFT_703837 [Mycena rebaudengoi]